MWFRGVSASMGLCFDLGTVLEGHPDVLFAVDGDVVHHRQPVCFPELRQRLPAPQVFQVCFDLVLSGGSSPRDINFLPGCRWFGAANEFSDTVFFFDCDGRGRLTPNGCVLRLPRPLHIFW